MEMMQRKKENVELAKQSLLEVQAQRLKDREVQIAENQRKLPKSNLVPL